MPWHSPHVFARQADHERRQQRGAEDGLQVGNPTPPSLGLEVAVAERCERDDAEVEGFLQEGLWASTAVALSPRPTATQDAQILRIDPNQCKTPKDRGNKAPQPRHAKEPGSYPTKPLQIATISSLLIQPREIGAKRRPPVTR